MTQRNFPASFWNSAYQHTAHAAATSLHASSAADSLQFSTDPYGTSLQAMTSLQDPWHHYSLTSPSHTAAYGTHRPSVHDFPYSTMTSSSRFNPAAHYGSLLVQQRSGRFAPANCDLNKPTDAWTARYHADTISPGDFNTSAHHIDPSHATHLTGTYTHRFFSSIFFLKLLKR